MVPFSLRGQSRAIRDQKRVLRKLLTTAFATEFGVQHGFFDVLNHQDMMEEFRRRVPVHTYSDMAVWWDRARKGERDITWKGIIKYFALSSGTSEGASKYVPVSKHMIRAIQRSSLKQYASILKDKEVPVSVFSHSSVMMGSSTNLRYVGSHQEGDLSGIVTTRIPLWFEAFVKPGVQTRRMAWQDKIHAIADQARDWDVSMIGGVPAWIIMLFEEMCEKYHVESIHEIWPHLKVYFHGGVAITPYLTALRSFFREEVFLFETYLASEGFFAYQSRLHAEGMKLIANNGIFFEFIPFTEEYFDEEGNLRSRYPKTHHVEEIVEGQEYAMVISTCSGAWRYLIGDTVRFESLKHMEISITGRTKHYLSLCQEHLSVENMNDALAATAAAFGVQCQEYCVAGIKLDAGFAHEWYVSIDKEVNRESFTRMLDDKLRELNDDYATEREYALKKISVRFLPNEAFTSFLAELGKQGAQVKFPRVIKGGQYYRWLDFLQKNLF
ncbi:MAG: GH3 auxin-responsive promoter family protein [Bacteroidetes bacterium]|nr:GH3 auxin-responsive promoter family protein [Bacteroidota bacterium]